MPGELRIAGITPLVASRPMKERGQSVVEYALIVALIVTVAVVALTLFGTQIDVILSLVASTING